VAVRRMSTGGPRRRSPIVEGMRVFRAAGSLIGLHAAQPGGAHHVDSIVNPLDALKIFEQSLQHLLQIKRRHAAANGEHVATSLKIEFPRSAMKAAVASNDFISGLLDAIRLLLRRAAQNVCGQFFCAECHPGVL
jgi:hypothetical protein